ncbi:MAG: peptidase [Rariglobus sp.]|jgi:hypothetical protein|nr:peptidase [Rariglobus sp.]
MSRSRPTSLFLTAGGLLLVLGLLFYLTHRRPDSARVSTAAEATEPGPRVSSLPYPSTDIATASDGNLSQAASIAALAETLSSRLNHPATRAHEAILMFKTTEGYHRFLARAVGSGVIVTGQIDALNIVRVRVRAYDAFAAELVARAADYGGVSANTFVQLPPPPEERAASRQVAVGDALLATLGVSAGTNTSAWGRGVTVAILDGGAGPDPTLGARLRYLDVGLGYAGTGAAGLHGTAVAAIAAGSSPDAPGVAPAATILSIRVTNTDDKSDVFTVTQAIVAAVDAGAQVINLSLGGYSTSEALNRAITYAVDHGIVIVAAAGNDAAARLTWPAADPRVVSVGATDATGRQAGFSNSGAQLHLTAPGVGLRTAGLASQRTLFSGTSASAPVVSGAIAALMSQTPGLTAAQAVGILQTYADDGGPAGTDPDYGHGTLDLGWALAREDRSRIDTAVSGHHYDAGTASLEVILQNRGALPANGLKLTVDLNGRVSTHTIPALDAGRSATVPLPIDAATAAGPITLRTRLENPEGVTDTVPANNFRASLIDLAGR